MVDSIQASVSIPIPKYQTGEGTHDPLPTTSPAEIDRSDNARHDQTQQTKKDDFEHYLNQRSITNLAETTKSQSFDTVKDIEERGVYHHPLDKTQF
jgi:hypothetical protein